jgi:hypothetical protein
MRAKKPKVKYIERRSIRAPEITEEEFMVRLER